MAKRTRPRKGARNKKRAASLDLTEDDVADQNDATTTEQENEDDMGSEVSSESEVEDDNNEVLEKLKQQLQNPPTAFDSTSSSTNKRDMSVSDGRYRNKQRCLVLCSRGVTARYRHLLEDLRTLLPHHKKDSKLDPGKSTPGSVGGIGHAVNEICEVKSCNSYIFLECKKRGLDAYLYMGYAPSGPSVKFHLANVHTMDELRLTGNCMKGSRPVLTFDESFGRIQHLKLLKNMFVDIFGTPRGHPKSKPFVDRVMGFYYADNKIWVRNYQIQEAQATNAKEEAELLKAERGTEGAGLQTSLIEIGPRFVLDPIRIFSGSFWGQTIYQNQDFVSPSNIRADRLRHKGGEYKARKESQIARKRRKEELVVEEDPLDSVFR